MIVLLFGNLLGETYRYSISGGLIGSVAEAVVTHHETKGDYHIRIDLVATGLAKMMSGNQKEHHISFGTIKNGEYYAKEYKIDKTYKNIHYIRRYLFDYAHQKITKISTKWKDGEKQYQTKTTLGYFAHNDILTLYHNVMRYKKKKGTGQYAIKLAGAEKEGGKLTFVLSDQKQFHGLESIKLFLHRSFFAKGKGALTLGIDGAGIVQEGVLDSVKLLGEVRLKKMP